MPAHLQDGSVSTTLVRQQVDKILHSGEFSQSEVLRHLLTFLTQHSIEKPGEAIKEYELAVTVLGRPEGFDPRLDSAVRVHAARLRSKLAEYYMSDGAEDSVLIEVPKGSYHVAWRYRAVESVRPQKPLPEPAVPASPKTSHWRAFASGFAVAAALACLSLGIWMSARTPKVAPQVEAFWQPFFQSPQEPVIVFSNHRFTGTSATGLHYFRDGIDSPADANDTYSGTGTVMAVGELSNLFSLAGRSPRFKRAELMTWDEAKDANVVFVGAPEANSRLGELAPLQHLRFKSSYEEPHFGAGGIINVHPANGEEAIYLGPGRPYAFDYAVVALLPNLRSERKVLILAGTNTYGCQAATEFVTRADMVGELYRRLGVARGEKLPDFEALLKVGVNGGVPMGAEILLIRRRQLVSAGK